MCVVDADTRVSRLRRRNHGERLGHWGHAGHGGAAGHTTR
ncbi:hypothetical protein F750_6178 [Streptomyces sp. PAMC 26508]|nr:hypothetical protein F750_6178 [Streptomyces sp. PAMC 26508]